MICITSLSPSETWLSYTCTFSVASKVIMTTVVVEE